MEQDIITFNLATYEYTDKRATFLAALVFSLLLIVFAGYNYTAYESVRAQSARAMEEVEELRGEISALKKKMQESKNTMNGVEQRSYEKKLQSKIEWLNDVIGRKEFSWSRMLYSLEKAAPSRLSVKTIRPNFSGNKINIAGEAKAVAAVTTFVDSLQGTEYIKKSFLLKENLVLIDKKYEAVSFEIECEGNF